MGSILDMPDIDGLELYKYMTKKFLNEITAGYNWIIDTYNLTDMNPENIYIMRRWSTNINLTPKSKTVYLTNKLSFRDRIRLNFEHIGTPPDYTLILKMDYILNYFSK